MKKTATRSKKKEPGIREVRGAGGSAWEVRITRRGFAPLSKSFPTLEEARAEKNRYLARIAEGKSPINRRAEKFTVADAIQDYRKDNPDAPAAEKYRLNGLESDIGHWPMMSLTHKAIDNYIAKKSKQIVPPPKNRQKTHPLFNGDQERVRAPASVRKIYFTLKKVAFKHRVNHVYELPLHAFAEQNVPPAWANSKERRLESGEEQKILGAIDKSYVNNKEWKRLILWALESGMRAQELLKTEWKDINFEQRFINIRKQIVKTKTYRQVPLSKKAVKILKEHLATKRDDIDRIFWQWSSSASLGRNFRVIVKNANLDNPFTIHDLRHEAISRLFENTDLSVMEIATISGHTDTKTLKRYTHLRAELLADRMDGKIKLTPEDYKKYTAWKADEDAMEERKKALAAAKAKKAT